MTRMRGMLEDENHERLQAYRKDLQAFNQDLAQQKRDRENQWRQTQENLNQHEIARTNMSDFMTEARNTTSSQLAPHRYVPYHFKGLRPEQIEAIKQERAG